MSPEANLSWKFNCWRHTMTASPENVVFVLFPAWTLLHYSAASSHLYSIIEAKHRITEIVLDRSIIFQAHTGKTGKCHIGYDVAEMQATCYTFLLHPQQNICACCWCSWSNILIHTFLFQIDSNIVGWWRYLYLLYHDCCYWQTHTSCLQHSSPHNKKKEKQLRCSAG